MQAFNINKAEAQKIQQIKSEAEYKILKVSISKNITNHKSNWVVGKVVGLLKIAI